MGEFCPSMTTSLALSDFDFALPRELIAQHPAAERSAARLLDASVEPAHDRRVVDDEQVAGAQQLGQVADAAVARRLGACVEQAGGAPLGHGVLGDQLARQREVEIAQDQGSRHRRAKFSHGPSRAAQIEGERR